MPKSLLDLAYDYVKEAKEPVPFNVLWAHVCEEAGISSEVANAKVGQFYTNLTLDARLVVLKNNLIDLKTRHESKEYIIDMKDAYTEAEIEDGTEDDEALQEERSLSGEDKVEENLDYEDAENEESEERR